jgi:CubicO group peptidase (beta-lactamase class C family)
MDIPPVEENQHPEIHKRLHEGYSAPLINLPGKEMSYCSFGIILIGELIRRISGKSLSDYITERILMPLGMKNTYLIVPKEAQERSVRYPKESCYGQWLANDQHFEIPSAAGGIYSTARDMTVFAQMYLNGGSYGDKRILSPVTVREMARDHIPGIPASHDNMDFAQGLWGLSWNIFENKKDPESGALHSPSAYGHGGAGHTVVWIDPGYETVGCFYHMELEMSPFRPDNLFRNAIMSAITEI